MQCEKKPRCKIQPLVGHFQKSAGFPALHIDQEMGAHVNSQMKTKCLSNVSLKTSLAPVFCTIKIDCSPLLDHTALL